MSEAKQKYQEPAHKVAGGRSVMPAFDTRKSGCAERPVVLGGLTVRGGFSWRINWLGRIKKLVFQWLRVACLVTSARCRPSLTYSSTPQFFSQHGAWEEGSRVGLLRWGLHCTLISFFEYTLRQRMVRVKYNFQGKVGRTGRASEPP